MSNNGSGAEQVVRDYFDSLRPSQEAFLASFDRFFDDETVWENVGIATTVGKEQAIAFLENFPVPVAYMTVSDVTIASSGDTVFAERYDHFHDKAGNLLFSAKLNGVFIIRNGKIAEWRDYCDTAALGAKLQELAGQQQ